MIYLYWLIEELGKKKENRRLSRNEHIFIHIAKNLAFHYKTKHIV
jgi:hypothetical protein